MIKKTDKVKFTVPQYLHGRGGNYSVKLPIVMEGVAVSDEYESNGVMFVDVNINGIVTALKVDNLEVI